MNTGIVFRSFSSLGITFIRVLIQFSVKMSSKFNKVIILNMKMKTDGKTCALTVTFPSPVF